MYISITNNKFARLKKNCCIARNIGGELNLADLDANQNLRNLETNVSIYSLHVVSPFIALSTCTKTDQRFTKLRYFKEVALQLVCQKSHLFKMKNSDVQTKKWKLYGKKGPQAQTNVMESIITTCQRRDGHVDSATAKKNTGKKNTANINFASFFAKPPNKFFCQYFRLYGNVIHW